MYITNENCKVNGVLGKTSILFIVLLQFFPLYSQVKKDEQPLQMEEYPLKIWIISRFLDFVKWPPGSETNQGSRQFVVGIIGDTAMLECKDDSSMGWQPIETAPRDGTFVVCAVLSGHITILQWSNHIALSDTEEVSGWRRGVSDVDPWQPTHWMCLPEPPIE